MSGFGKEFARQMMVCKGRRMKDLVKYEGNRIQVPRFEEEQGFYTTEARSNLMSKIRSTNTKPEVLFRKALWQAGVRYRLYDSTLPGKPDIANRKRGFVVFIDGAFWHGYDWTVKKEKIKSNRDFWIPKIERNMQRDREVNTKLSEMGYKVFRFWDHEIKKGLEKCVLEIVEWITKG